MKKGSKKLKILFFGLGSIGKKHARIIRDNYDYELFAYRTNKGQESSDLKISEIKNLKDAFLMSPDIAFITNPTNLHVQIALECAKNDISLFIEKPISHSLEDVDRLDAEIKKRKLISYVAYNLRFHPVLIKLKEILLRKDDPIYFRARCSSYLPSWRPNQDYSKSYSAKKELGGGVLLDLSHEFDYLTWFFGDISDIKGYCEKKSNLKIETEDLIEAQISFSSGLSGHLHLDYFCPSENRNITIYCNEELIEADLNKNQITITKNKSKPKLLHIKDGLQDSYIKQMDYFFKEYNKKNIHMMNAYPKAIKTFKKIMQFKHENCKEI